jgi:hypothetical protein
MSSIGSAILAGPFSRRVSQYFYAELNICSLVYANNGWITMVMNTHKILEENPEERCCLDDQGDGIVMLKCI